MISCLPQSKKKQLEYIGSYEPLLHNNYLKIETEKYHIDFDHHYSTNKYHPLKLHHKPFFEYYRKMMICFYIFSVAIMKSQLDFLWHDI